MKNIVIPLDRDFNSVLNIGTPAFPFEIFYDDLENYSDGFVNWHKQRQIEISYVLNGCVRLHEFGKEHLLRGGDGFVILPGVMHSVKPEPHRAAQYVTCIFDPVFLYGYEGSYFENTYYTPLRNKGAASCLLKRDAALAKPALAALHRLFEGYRAVTPLEQLSVQRRLQDAWILLFDQFSDADSHRKIRAQEARIGEMIAYLHENYQSKFSLTHMAGLLSVSRGECCRCFKKMVGMTIARYLLEYRISKSLELLESTSMTVTEISQTVGIESTSYFIAAFKEKMATTPLLYRTSCRRAT